MSIYKLSEPVFSVDVVLYLDEPEKFEKRVRSNNEHLPVDEKEGMCIFFEAKRLGVLYIKSHSRNETAVNLSHECLHLAMYIFNYFGILFEADARNEVLCCYHDFLLGTFLKQIYKDKR